MTRAVPLLAFALLCFGIERWSLGGAFVDPIGQIRAQDEAVYSHTAIMMATDGDWLTPRFLDRFAMYKPPLAYWLAGGSAKVLGISMLSLRLPSLVAGALGAWIVFLWVRRERSLLPALLAAGFTLTSTLWYSLSRLALTDALLSTLCLAALYFLSLDPEMRERRTSQLFGACAGAAIMTKGIAGLLPLMALGVYWLWKRPRFTAVLLTGAVAAAVAAPWHLYQWAAHSRWFLAEYVGVEILRYALGAPPQTSGDPTWAFYFARFFRLDPVLSVTGVIGLVWAWRKRELAPVVCLAGVLVAAVFGYQYRNIAYWMPLVPLLAIAAGRFVPAIGLAAGLVIKVVLAAAVFSASYQTPVTPALRTYCGMARAHDVFLVGLDDEFHATVLPLAHVRYVFIAPPPEYGAAALDFRRLGVTRTAQEYLRNEPPQDDLLRWGLPNRKALATVILAGNEQEVREIMAARPQADFIAPSTYGSAEHARVEAADGRVLLLSKERRDPRRPRWGCAL
jgi:4-amino-4-deoxy-L-arabinose transferase-like glycosyltransferase